MASVYIGEKNLPSPCLRKNMEMVYRVEVGIILQKLHGRGFAARYLARQKVPCEVAVRVLCDPKHRRSMQDLH